MPQPHYIHSTPYKALPDWLETLNFTHFVTLTFNQSQYHRPDQILEYARDKLKFFHAKLDCLLLGSRWAKKSRFERTLFIAFPEKIPVNMHYHLFMRIPSKHENQFYRHAENLWTGIVPSGTYDCKLLKDAPNTNGLFSYATKEQFKNVNFNHIIISSEFLNI
jgi:hypothetical protein